MNDWTLVKQSLVKNLNSRNLKVPRIRLNALERVESYLKSICDIENLFELVENNQKDNLLNSLTKVKKSDLNGAEKSIINDLYKIKNGVF